MTSTGTTTTPAATNIFQQIEAALSSDAQKAVTFFQNLNSPVGTFLGKVAQGLEIFIEDVEAVANWVNAHLTLINGLIADFETTAAAVAPNNPAIGKALSDLNTAATDIAGLSTSLTTGSSSSQPAAVQTATTAINGINSLSILLSSASSQLAQAAASSANATTAVSSSGAATP